LCENLSCDLRGRFERGDDDSDLFVSGPLVLARCCRDLFDGTALRSLYEFSNIHDVSLNLQHLLAEVGTDRATSLLTKSREEQVELCVQSCRTNPTTRKLWLLRTYAGSEPVQKLLQESAIQGELAALVSLFFRGDTVDWLLFDSVDVASGADYRFWVNLAIENILRGANRGELEGSGGFRRLPVIYRDELRDGLALAEAF
jgi:hypothetical protein